MICRLTGQVAGVSDSAVMLEIGGVCYEVLVPPTLIESLNGSAGGELTLHTLQYLEGSPASNQYIPRLIGFASEQDREFFLALLRVRGLSTRKALRAMRLPTPAIAAAIEHGDLALLTSLPEIGRKTAQAMLNELRGSLAGFLRGPVPGVAEVELSEPQKLAVEILVQWGDRRADAQRWVRKAVQDDPTLTEPQEIVRAAYRVKQRQA